MIRCDLVTATKTFTMDMTDLEWSDLYIGEYRNPNTRAELQGLPRLKGFNGPMYNGLDENGNAKFLYETKEVYDSISID